MKRARNSSTARSRRGMAIVIVLVVLLVLLVLATPFLLMARNADAASNELADRADVRIALDTAGRHLRAVLQESHATADKTPYWDARDEIDVSNQFDPKFLVASDPRGAMWDAAVEDVAGKIDLNSCSPHVIANLMGLTKRFSEAVADDAKTLKLSSALGLKPEGLVWATGELVQYTKIDESALVKFTRGVLGPPKGQDWKGGPRPASPHDLGEPVLDQRALAPCLWRTVGENGTLRPYAALEELAQCAEFDMAAVLAKPEGGSPAFDAAAFDPLFRTTTVHAGIGAGAVWQHPTRVTTQVEARKDGKVRVESVRWINSGSTVQITDGTNTEIALVQSVSRGGEVFLDKLLANDFVAYRAELRVLARRPVNLNTASPEVLTALFTNLQIGGRNSRILREEAQRIGSIVIQSRPLEGFEDFLRRVVLPCAGLEKLPSDAPVVPEELVSGAGFLTADKALALYSNGLNANDGALAFATMPYCFTTRDVYEFELRAGVNALSGVERASRVRDEVAVIAPQRELFRVWGRQEDFDEAGRLDCGAPWWMSGPNATTRYDVRPNPPASPPSSFVWAHMGTAGGQTYLPGVTDTSAFKDAEAPTPEHVFPSREQTAWVQLWPYRTDEMGQRAKRVLHFDHETRDLEGRYLPDQPIRKPSDDPVVHWSEKQSASGRPPLARPFALDLWVKPRSLGPGRLLDFGGSTNETDRVSLLLENEDLVLRIFDGTGDHPDTEFKEASEVRFKLAAGPGPGLPVDVWSHVSLQVNGNRPSQVDVRVNGFAHGVRRLGMTRLTSALSQGVSELNVESTEGFPDRGVVRVGNELIEVTKTGNAFSATRAETGQYAGFGGRLAREKLVSDDGTGPSPYPRPELPADLGQLTTDHPAGATVELYGYSAPLATSVSTGASTLPAELGPWRVARVSGVVGGETPEGNPIQPTTWLGANIGWGLDGTGGSPSSNEPTGLVLASADDPSRPASDYMPAFDPRGGYAAIIQAYRGSDSVKTQRMALFGGVEIIRYSGVQGTTLLLEQRGITASELPRLAKFPPGLDLDGLIAVESRAFVVKWNENLFGPLGATFATWNRLIRAAVYVVPISLAVPNATSTDYDQNVDESRFAQLTHLTDAENTEWVRYDEFIQSRGQLVRDSTVALNSLYNVLVHEEDIEDLPQPPVPGGGGGGGGGGTSPGGSAIFAENDPNENEPASKLAPAPSAALPPLAPAQYSGNWEPRMGKSELADFPLSDAAQTRLQFRGVLGTFSHKHPAGTLVLPVFAVHERLAAGGRPGRLDAAFLVGANSDHPGWPVTVHRAHTPAVNIKYAFWDQDTASSAQPFQQRAVVAAVPAGDVLELEGLVLDYTYVALSAKAPEPMVPESLASTGSALVEPDPRERSRLVCFPSGELPRQVDRVAVGGTRDGSNGDVPSVLVDEIVFGDARVSNFAVNGALPYTGASFVVDTPPLSEEGLTLRVLPKLMRTANDDRFEDHKFLGDLPEDAGLLRIGEEIVCYDKRDPETGEFQLCTGGRGLLGTRAQPHDPSEPVLFLEHATVTFLASGIGATDAALPVANTEEFPEQGTVLIGEEIIHYTRLRSGVLEMPRASSVAGHMDEKGEALFRGRFGTTPATHAAGEAVILFQVRYWDRWAPRADASEMSFFTLTADQPAAFWSSCVFQKEDTANAQLGVLQRTDPTAPWDADPEHDKRLTLFWSGDDRGAPHAIGKQSDQIAWRAFVKYSPGAFDFRTGLATGWRQTPRLKLFATTFYAPSLTLRSVER